MADSRATRIGPISSLTDVCPYCGGDTDAEAEGRSSVNEPRPGLMRVLFFCERCHRAWRCYYPGSLHRSAYERRAELRRAARIMARIAQRSRDPEAARIAATAAGRLPRLAREVEG
jgi:uncharacterized protein with PIN domain